MITLHRIEPDPRVRDLRRQARVPVADPAWTLARQWWVGELDGSDGGAPIVVSFRLDETDLGGDRPGGAAGLSPSAALADPPPKPGAPGAWREALRIGRAVRRQILGTERKIEDLISRTGDPSGNLRETLQSLADSRRALAEGFPLKGPSPALRRVPADERIDGLAIVQGFVARDPRLLRLGDDAESFLEAEARGARDAARFEPISGAHDTGLGTATGRVPVRGALGPSLHWSDLAPGQGATAPDRQRDVEAVPARLSFAGDSPPRWWNLEDASVAWASAPAGPSDLGQLVLAAGLANQSEVMWLVPFDVPANTLVAPAGVLIVDGFGNRIEPARSSAGVARSWRTRGGRALLAMLAEGGPMLGEPLEQAAFGLDETDNLAWAEERIAMTDTARGLVLVERRTPVEVDERALALRVPPPANWHPYRADRTGLTLSPLSRPGGAQEPRTAVLPDRLDVPPAALGPSGTVIERRWNMARTPSGARHFWSVSLRVPGKLFGSSGLAHDVIVDREI